MPEKSPESSAENRPNIFERVREGLGRFVQTVIGGMQNDTRETIDTAGAELDQEAWKMVKRHGLETTDVLMHLGDIDGVLARAFEALLQNRLKEAEEMLKGAGEPISADFHRILGNYYLEKKKYHLVLHAYKKLPPGPERQTLLRQLLDSLKTDLSSVIQEDAHFYIACFHETMEREPTTDELLGFHDILEANGLIVLALQVLHIAELKGKNPKVFIRLGDHNLDYYRKNPGVENLSKGTLEAAIRNYAKANHVPGIIAAARLLIQIDHALTVQALKDTGSIMTLDAYRVIAQAIPAEDLKARTLFWSGIHETTGQCSEGAMTTLANAWLEKGMRERDKDSLYYAEICYSCINYKPGFKIIGDSFRKLEFFIEAARCYKVAGYEPSDADFYLKLGGQLVIQGKAEEAKNAFRRALELGYKDGGGSGGGNGGASGGGGGKEGGSGAADLPPSPEAQRSKNIAA